jgi:hypothetical protein
MFVMFELWLQIVDTKLRYFCFLFYDDAKSDCAIQHFFKDPS